MLSPVNVRLHARAPTKCSYRCWARCTRRVSLLVEEVTATFGAEVHGVVDLSALAALTPAGIAALVELDRAATRRRTQLHIVGGVRAHTVRRAIGNQLRLETDGVSRPAAQRGATTVPTP